MDMITLAIVAVIGYAFIKSKGMGGGGGMAAPTTPAPDATPETGGTDPETEGGGMGGGAEGEGEYGDEGEDGGGGGNGMRGRSGGKGGSSYGGGKGGKGGGRDRSGYGDRDMDREYSGRGGDSSYGKGSKGKKGGYGSGDDQEICQALIMALIRGVRIAPHLLERCENVKIRDISGRYRMPIPFYMTYGMYNYRDPLGYTGIPMSYYRNKYGHQRGRYTTLSNAYNRSGSPYGRSDMYRDAYTTKWGYY